MNEQQQRDLAAGLKALADATRGSGASPHVESAILAAMAGRPGTKPQPTSTEYRGPSTAYRVPNTEYRTASIAAALLLAVGGALWYVSSAPRSSIGSPAGFVALPAAAALPEMESATIVRVSLPVTALPMYGIAIQPDIRSDEVVAELLVAQDGQPRAIRLVTESD
jgi:hypothetical protein